MIFERAEQIQTKAVGPEHPGVAHSLLGRGVCHLERGEADAALPLLERALKIRESASVGAVERARARFAVARAVAPGERRKTNWGLCARPSRIVG